jgi:hypothetical protein
LGIFTTDRGEKDSVESMQYAEIKPVLKSFGQCFRLVYCLESLRGAIG